jgi:hypothetical protein
MILKFPNTRGLPRQGEYLYCFTVPKELRSYKDWGNKTYGDLIKAKTNYSEIVCIWQTPSNEIDFSSYSEGGIKLFGGFTFNNISYYLSSGLGLKSELTVRTWQNVFTADGATPSGTTWAYWNGNTWQYVYITGQATSYITTPTDIYQAYVGTNSSIIDDNGGMLFKQSEAEILTGVSWQDLSLKPA